MKHSFIIFFFVIFNVSAQDSIVPKAVDLKFREDHFYLGIVINSLQNRPDDFSQSKLSPGFQFGYLRDLPINSARTFSIAPGLGLSYMSNNLNMIIDETDSEVFYQTVSSGSFSKNRLSYYSLDMPIEFRWRNVKPDSHQFFRIYTGFKMGYILRSIYVNESQGNSKRINNLSDINRFVYGVYLTAGYNTWNFYVYYGLNRMFDRSAQINNSSIDINTLSLGLQFYIL